MLQLTRLGSGQLESVPVNRYPFRIGRDASDHLRLEAPGVWGGHCTLELRAAAGIHLTGNPQAVTVINGQPVRETRLRNGDIIELGNVRLLASIGPAPQRSFRRLEALVWTALAALGLSQLYLMLAGLP
jgi:pSer/pThr/pTyr-binding forkhead associated (FHA) protein